MHEWKYRFSDPSIGRFISIDPLAEDFVYNSTYAFQENRLGLGTELEGAELQFHEWLINDAVKNPNGTSAKIVSFAGRAGDYVSAMGSRVGDNLNAMSNQIHTDLNEFASHGPSWELFRRYNPMNGFGMQKLQPGDIENSKIDFSNPNSVADQIATPLVMMVVTKGKGKKSLGRSGKQARLRELSNDSKLGKADRGWIKSEINQINRGNRKNIRNPPGKDLAHQRGREAAKGYSYEHSNLQDRDLHRMQHKYDNGGRKNKERPLNR